MLTAMKYLIRSPTVRHNSIFAIRINSTNINPPNTNIFILQYRAARGIYNDKTKLQEKVQWGKNWHEYIIIRLLTKAFICVRTQRVSIEFMVTSDSHLIYDKCYPTKAARFFPKSKFKHINQHWIEEEIFGVHHSSLPMQNRWFKTFALCFLIDQIDIPMYIIYTTFGKSKHVNIYRRHVLYSAYWSYGVGAILLRWKNELRLRFILTALG